MKPSQIVNKRILISPLNWGMGHVSRCIGLIDQLTEQDNTVIVACDEMQKSVFIQYFPDLTYINHEGYPFKFGGQGRFGLDLLLRAKSLKERLTKELSQVESYVAEYNVDVVLSDHRYGFLSTKVDSIFITHQYNLPVRWFEKMVSNRHKELMKAFGEIWILDTSDSNFAGELSISVNDSRVEYVGPYSRFQRYAIPMDKQGKIAVVISGPSVYGQKLADSILPDLHPDEVVVIASDEIEIPEQFQRISGNWIEQDQLLLHAPKIISYAGYSTIMDLHFLKTESSLSATIGQREQEYLLSLESK